MTRAMKALLEFETSAEVSSSTQIFEWEITFFLKNCVTSEGAVSRNVSYHQQFSIARVQVSLYANNYLE